MDISYLYLDKNGNSPMMNPYRHLPHGKADPKAPLGKVGPKLHLLRPYWPD